MHKAVHLIPMRIIIIIIIKCTTNISSDVPVKRKIMQENKCRMTGAGWLPSSNPSYSGG
jgi:hypothetical protein